MVFVVFSTYGLDRYRYISTKNDQLVKPRRMTYVLLNSDKKGLGYWTLFPFN